MPELALPTPGLISLVIPVFNEHDSLLLLHAEIDAVSKTLAERVEIVFVDDGSKDGSWDGIERLAASDPRVKGIRFRRNFGKAAALQAGFAETRGEIVFTLDADLQDDPAEIPQFLAQVRAGTDVVSGYKKTRHDPWHKVFPSRVFNWMVSKVTGVKLHDHNCGYKAYRAEVVREVRLYGELHRYVPVLAAAKGFTVGERVVNHRPRSFGKSKYGWKRFIKGFLDLWSVRLTTAFGWRPMHFLGTLGLMLMSMGCCCGGGSLGLMVGGVGGGWFWSLVWTLIAVGGLASLIVGAQALLTGFVAESLASQRTDEPFVVSERT
jgi:dolichol-phosphate mannosyltransferase